MQTSRPKVVRAGKDGAPITDGVFPEAKEFLAGYWMVDVETLVCALSWVSRSGGRILDIVGGDFEKKIGWL